MDINIVIKGGGLTFDRAITMSQAGRIINFLGSDEADINQSPSENKASQERLIALNDKVTDLNLKDFIQEHNAKSYSEKIVATGYFIQETKNQSSFTCEDIKNELKRLGDYPAKFSRELNKAEKERQYLYCEDRKEEIYSVTEAGKDAVTNNFADSEGKKSLSKKKIGRQIKPSKSNIREEVSQVQISTVLDGFPKYHDLKTKWEKILWIIQFADKRDLGPLTAAEVEELSGKLKGRIAQSGFSAHNKSNITKGYVVMQSGGKYSIEQTGIDYLRGLVKVEDGE